MRAGQADNGNNRRQEAQPSETVGGQQQDGQGNLDDETVSGLRKSQAERAARVTDSAPAPRG
ncbi:hypothetical protein KRM28CT15_47210 [Krasilnikovia sp. M28-CT-15]